MRQKMMLFLLAVLLVAVTQQAFGAGLRSALSGEKVPLTLQLKDLDGSWRRMIIASQGGFDASATWLTMLLGRPGGAYYTRGETVSIGGDSFLVAYRVKPVEMASLLRDPARQLPAPEKLTPETTLRLSLINLREIVSFNDIAVFDLQEELAGAQQAQQAQQELFGEGAGEANSQEAASRSNLKQLSLAMVMYSQDWDEMLPPLENPEKMKAALSPYVKAEVMFTNPITRRPYLTNPILSHKKLAHIAFPADTAVIYEDSAAPDGTIGAAFLDGSARRVNEEEWERIKRVSKIR